MLLADSVDNQPALRLLLLLRAVRLTTNDTPSSVRRTRLPSQTQRTNCHKRLRLLPFTIIVHADHLRHDRKRDLIFDPAKRRPRISSKLLHIHHRINTRMQLELRPQRAPSNPRIDTPQRLPEAFGSIRPVDHPSRARAAASIEAQCRRAVATSRIAAGLGTSLMSLPT